jgi:hypothetical protein
MLWPFFSFSWKLAAEISIRANCCKIWLFTMYLIFHIINFSWFLWSLEPGQIVNGTRYYVRIQIHA